QPCLGLAASTVCDALQPTFSGLGVSTAWTNSVPMPASSPVASSARSSTAAPSAQSQTTVGPAPLLAPMGLGATPADGHVLLSWRSVAGAASYRVYRAYGAGPRSYVGQTSAPSFTDVGGKDGTAYGYQVAAVAPDGLVGAPSSEVTARWVAATTAPAVVRVLPAS